MSGGGWMERLRGSVGDYLCAKRRHFGAAVVLFRPGVKKGRRGRCAAVAGQLRWARWPVVGR